MRWRSTTFDNISAHSEVGSIETICSDNQEIDGKQAQQLEIEFLPTAVEDAADNLVLGRWLIRNVAYRHRCVASFAPKIEEGVAGNGLHIYVMLMRDGRNTMLDYDGELSGKAKQLIGGLCHYADTLTSFGNPMAAAYFRLVPNQEAPTCICWSDLNRTAMIRVPLGWSGVSNLTKELNPQQEEDFHSPKGQQTVELRSADGSALAHLLLAGMTMAAEWGLTHPESVTIANSLYVSGSVFRDRELAEKLPILPSSCAASACNLNQKREYYERGGVFPPGLIDHVIALLEQENDKDVSTRLANLPANDRLRETREILHKHLHTH